KVVAAFADQGVVARAAEQLIVAGAAGDDVVAGAAEQLRCWECTVGLVQLDRVVAAGAEHLDQGGVRDRRGAPRDTDRDAIDEDLSGCVATHGDRVVEIVVEHRQQAGGRRKTSFDSHSRQPSKGFGSLDRYLAAKKMTGLKPALRTP